MRKLLLITFSAAILVSTGCGSIESRSDGTQSGLYPGVKADLDGPSSAASIVDLPFSFALDTVLLPIDILGSVFKGKDDKPSEPEAAPQP